MTKATFSLLPHYSEYSLDELRKRAADFYTELRWRRSVRDFSDRPVPRDVIEDCLHAAGMLITAVHHAGLASPTHTPSPMSFLNEILVRPANERPFLLLVVGYPAEDARVPTIKKKLLHEYASFM